MSPMESDGVEDVVRGHGRLLVSAAGTAMTAAARALAQRNRAQREQDLRALAEAHARAETDRRLMLLRLEMAKSPSWRKEATLADAAETLYLARLYATVEPTAAAAVPTLEEHMRTRWEREPDEVLAERAQQARQHREEAREAQEVWTAGATAQPGATPDTPAATSPLDRLLQSRRDYVGRSAPLQEAAGHWVSILNAPERWHGADHYVRAWEAALPFVQEHPDPARAAVLAEEILRQLYPEKMAEFDALREHSGPQDALRQIGPQLTTAVPGIRPRRLYDTMSSREQARAADTATLTRVWGTMAVYRTRSNLDGGWAKAAQDRAEERLRELHPEVMARYDAMRHRDRRWATDKTVADLRALGAAERAQARTTSPVPAAAVRLGQTAEAARSAEPSTASSGSATQRRPGPESMHAHPAGVSTEQTSTPGAAKDQGLAERLLQQQRRRAAQARTERADRDGDGRSR